MIGLGIIVFNSLLLASSCAGNFWLFTFIYGFAFAIYQGMTYITPVHHGWMYFPNNPGLVSGIIIAGFGAGPLMSNFVATALINPWGDDIDP